MQCTGFNTATLAHQSEASPKAKQWMGNIWQPRRVRLYTDPVRPKLKYIYRALQRASLLIKSSVTNLQKSLITT